MDRRVIYREIRSPVSEWTIHGRVQFVLCPFTDLTPFPPAVSLFPWKNSGSPPLSPFPVLLFFLEQLQISPFSFPKLLGMCVCVTFAWWTFSLQSSPVIFHWKIGAEFFQMTYQQFRHFRPLFFNFYFLSLRKILLSSQIFQSAFL